MRPRPLPTLSVAVSLVLTAHTLVDPGGWRRRRALAADLAARSAASGVLAARAGALRAEVDALARSPAAQEQRVRDELGWIRPGDVLVHLHE